MVDIEKIIDYIKEARRKGFRDDAIKKRLLESGEPELKINDAFLGAGKPKRQNFRTRVKHPLNEESKTSVTIVLEKWLKEALEKKASENNLTLYKEIKKTLVEGINKSEIPKGVFKSRMFRRKMTDKEKKRHRAADWRYKARVDKERRKKRRFIGKKARLKRREERRKRK